MERQFRLNWNALVEEAKQRRKAINLTQEKIAILAQVSTPTVSRFENNNKDVQLSSAWRILKILGMTDERILQFEMDTEFYDTAHGAVVFFGSESNKRVRCAISGEALKDFFKAESGGSKDLLSVFRKHKETITHQAFLKYLTNQLEKDESILIQSRDLE